MKKFITIIIFIIIILTPVAYAVDSTPSADIKSKLEELKKEIASKAAKLKGEIDKKLKDKAYIGKVTTKSSTSLTLATKNGPKIVNINEDTVFESQIKSKSKQKFSQKTISEDDYVACLGDVDETGVLTARKIILLPNINSKIKTYLWGQIISISDKLVTIKGKDFKNVAVALPSESKVKLNDLTILTGSKNKNDIFEAEFVYIISHTASKSASPSARKK